MYADEFFTFFMVVVLTGAGNYHTWVNQYILFIEMHYYWL